MNGVGAVGFAGFQKESVIFESDGDARLHIQSVGQRVHSQSRQTVIESVTAAAAADVFN